MYNFGQVIGGCLTVLLFFLFSIIATTLIGALIGWVVGWFFGTTILNFFAAIGIEGFTMAEIGAVLGFVGGFFRGNIVNYNLANNKQNTNQGNF